MAADATANTVGRQCGALRCLGVMRSEKVKPHLTRAAKADDPRVRAAVAFASKCRNSKPPVGNAELKALAADPDAMVAFTAAMALSARGQTPGNLVDLARAVLHTDPRQIAALGVVGPDKGRLLPGCARLVVWRERQILIRPAARWCSRD